MPARVFRNPISGIDLYFVNLWTPECDQAGLSRGEGLKRAGQLRVTSYGESKPFAMGSNEASWAKNRRAHFERP